jgi:hypothetical protein
LKRARERVKETDVKIEKAHVLTFCLNALEHAPGNKITIQHLYDEYQEWLHSRGLRGPKVSIDGFGRLIPKQYDRRAIYVGDKRTLKGLVDVRLK